MIITSGVFANNGGCIYCALFDSNRIKKIDTIKSTFTTLTTENMHGSLASGALAIYGCIYFMPYSAEFVCLASDCFVFSYDTLSTLYNFPSDAFSPV